MFNNFFYTFNYESPEIRIRWVKTSLSLFRNGIIDRIYFDKAHCYDRILVIDREESNTFLSMQDSSSQLLPANKNCPFGKPSKNNYDHILPYDRINFRDKTETAKEKLMRKHYPVF